MADLQTVLAHLEGVVQQGDGWMAKCPSHEDNKASLSIGAGKNGHPVLHCFAGCSFANILAALDLPKGNSDAHIVATYDYRDESGALLYQKVRYEPKRFTQRKPDGAGGWSYKLGDTCRVLYRLPELRAGIERDDTVFVVEGEKDADRLASLGLVATTNSEGAAKTDQKAKWRPEYTEQLRGARRVVLLPDADEPGRGHMRAIAKALAGIVPDVRTIELPGLPVKGDVSDWLNAGHTKAELLALAEATASNELPVDAGAAVTDPISAAVERLAKLSAADYDRTRKAEAEALNIRVGTLDKLVAAERPAETSGAKGEALTFDTVEPWPDPVDGAELINDLAATFARYVVLPHQAAARALALWVLNTYVFDAFGVLPILLITSPEKRCGKTTLLSLLAHLCHRALAASNISPAAVFRVIQAVKPTLLIDEADTFLRDNEELRGVINSGHTRAAAFVIRTVEVNGDFEPRRFSTWAPKVIAMIGTPPGTIIDRSIRIAQARKLPGESVERLPLDPPKTITALRRQCVRWAHDCHGKLSENLLTGALGKTVQKMHSERAIDNWRPLLAIAALAGDVWLQQAIDAAVELSGQSAGDDQSTGIVLLEDIRTIFDQAKVERLATEGLIERLCKIDDHPWPTYAKGKPINPRQLSNLLRPFSVIPKTLRMGELRAKGYELEQFDDVFSRYLLPSLAVTPLSSRDTVTNRMVERVSEDSLAVTEQPMSRQEKPPEAAPQLDSHGVTAKNPLPGDERDVTDKKSPPGDTRITVTI
ncbi:MAG: DUF3631 domain-containing protein [Gammaproteobacteria bacterium]